MSELGPEARGILDAGRDGDDPTPADRARIRASVMRAVAAGAAVGAASMAGEAGAVGATHAALGWKVLAGLLIVAAAGGGAVLVRGDRGEPAPQAAASIAQSAPAPQPIAPPPVTAAPSASPLPEVAPPVTASAAPRVTERRREPSPPRDPSPPVADPPPLAEATPPPPAPPPTAPAAPPDTLAAETQRLREAHGAMQGGDAARALALLDEQGAAGGQLREERAAARVLALCRLGRTDEARAAAARFLAESPRSPLADRVRASCAAR